jgi:ribonucleoside-diphosphate reductase beta chain
LLYRSDEAWRNLRELPVTGVIMKTDILISNEVATVNQILPHVNKWAWELFLKGSNNNWMPTDISMQKDIEQWRSEDALSADERLVVKRCLGFFAGSESLVANNLLLSIFKYVTDAECRQYISRQNFEESLHNLTIVYICDSLGLDIKEVYEAYQSIPSIKAKDDFLMKITSNINRKDFDINTVEGKKELLRNIFTYYIVCEGTFFYSGFAMLLSFGRRNKLPGIAEQIQYTLRDESLHIYFGTKLINKLAKQFPEAYDKKFQEESVEHLKKAVELEIAYAKDVLPRGILGLNSEMFVNYMKYIANRRLEDLNLPKVYSNVSNPFGWMSEVIDLTKLKNFFETTVNEYQVSSMVDDF